VSRKRAGAPRYPPRVQQRQAVRGCRVAEMTCHTVERSRAVLAVEIVGQAYALGRDRRIQLERGEPPAQLGGLFAEIIECSEPARRADVAPRSDDVGPDHDVDHGGLLLLAGRRWVLSPTAVPVVRRLSGSGETEHVSG
jgi:hypothetical protein